MLYNVVSSTSTDPEVCQSNSKIYVMLDQKYDADLDDKWLTADEMLTYLYNIEIIFK